MKKNSHQGNSSSKFFGVLILGIFLIALIWAGGKWGFMGDGVKDFLSPVFAVSRGINNFFHEGSIAELENEKTAMVVQNSLLEARVRELEGMLGVTSAKRTTEEKIAVLSSQAPAVPYGTIIVSYDDNSGIRPGMKAIGLDGIYLGEVMDVGRKTATIKLVSFPGLKSESWLERHSLNITLEGQGGYNLKFSLPKSLKVEVGDKILSNTSPQYLIGEIEAIEEKPSDPLQEILLRLPLNFRNLRYVELVD